MGKSRRVRLRDVRDIYRLLGECCEVGGDLRAWRQRMCEGLGRLLSPLNVNGGLVTPELVRAGRLPMPGDEAAFDWGWQSDGQRDVFAEYWEEVGHTDPTFLAMIRIAQPVATRRRCELVDDRAWYGGEHFNDFYRRADVDDCIISRTIPPPESGLAMFFVRVTRAMGDPAYTVREQRILRLFVAGLAPLIGTKLASVASPNANGITPRMRDVLARLLRGDSEKQVAARLGISRHTVHDHVKRLYRHFGVSSRGELLAACLGPGPLPPGHRMSPGRTSEK